MNLPWCGRFGESPFDGDLERGSVAAHSYVKYIADSIVMSSIFWHGSCKGLTLHSYVKYIGGSQMQVKCKSNANRLQNQATPKCKWLAIGNLC